MSVAGVPPHGHCEICQTTVDVGERFCGSEACAQKHLENVKEKKLQVYKMMGLIVAAVLLSFLLRGI